MVFSWIIRQRNSCFVTTLKVFLFQTLETFFAAAAPPQKKRAQLDALPQYIMQLFLELQIPIHFSYRLCSSCEFFFFSIC